MIDVDADHSVKFDAQLVRAWLVSWNFLPFSVPAPRESLKFWGQYCGVKTRITAPMNQLRPTSPCVMILRRQPESSSCSASSKVLLTDADIEAFIQALIKDQGTFASREQWMRTQAAALQATNR